MRMVRTLSAALAPVILLGATPSPAAAQERPFRPTTAGSEPRHDGWNSDGAPRPPRMWRGHGGTMWTDHYHACRRAYGSRYDYRTDTVRRGGGARRRCAL